MFACLIILLYSTSVLAIPNGRTQVTYPSLETLRSGIKILKLRAFDQDIELRLEPAGEVISDDYAIMDEEGNIEAIDVKSMKEKLFRDQKRGAALYIDENGLIEIDGIINSKLRIKPFESQEERHGMKEHLIIEIIEEEKHLKDAVKSMNLQRSFSEDNNRDFNEDQCVEIEYVFMAENHTKELPIVDKFNTYILTLAVQSQNLMDTLNLNIKISAIGTIVMPIELSFIKDSLFPGENVLNVNLIKKNMEEFICENIETEHFSIPDILVLLTGREIGVLDSDGSISTGVLGLSNLGGLCEKCGKFAVIKLKDDQHVVAVTMTQESAHLLGSPYDGEGGDLSLPGSPGSTNCPASDGYLMGDNSGENKDKFSSCSLENIKYFLGLPKASCAIIQCENTEL